ncbi:MAG: hypothetical protein ACI9UN_000351 [Granulosicoccus sp.]|jgi:hypothetical protein
MRVVAALTMVTLAVIPYAAHSTLWSCSNPDMEIQCQMGECKTSDGFTPLSVQVNGMNGDMSVCAYSACYEGKGVVMKNNHHVFFSGLRLLNSNTNEISNFMIGINIDNETAVINGSNFAMPLMCEKIQ